MSYTLDIAVDKLTTALIDLLKGEIEIVRTDPDEKQTTWSFRSVE